VTGVLARGITGIKLARMTTPLEQRRPWPSRAVRPVAVLATLLLAIWLLSQARGMVPSWLAGGDRTPRVTHEVVVQQVESVAKLVSSQMTLRDVVIFENSRFGSTKRGLYVITGKVLAGIDLEQGTGVKIDHEARRITISLPPAKVLAVDVLNVTTYDEHSGLLNPFNPEDRDAIRSEIRARLVAAATGSGILQQADTSARRVLRALLSRDGYTVDVGLPPTTLNVSPAR
jgi:hypothetical protein